MSVFTQALQTKKSSGSAFSSQNQTGTMFGVTMGDASSHSFGKTDGGSKGVQIADPSTAGATLSFVVPGNLAQDFRDLDIESKPADPRYEYIVVATRPPQHLGCRLSLETAKTLPIVLEVTQSGDGVCAPIYRLAQAAYDEVKQLCGHYGFGLPQSFTSRGHSPDICDDTLLWDLPSLDEPNNPPNFVRAAEGGVFDVLGWLAWTSVLKIVNSFGFRTQVVQEFFANDFAILVKQLYTVLENKTVVSLEGRVREMQVRIIAFGHFMETSAQRYMGRVGATFAFRVLRSLDSSVYPGICKLLVGMTLTDCTARELVRAAVWLSEATHYLEEGKEHDECPCPEIISSGIPLEIYGFAGVIGAWSAENCGLTKDLSLAIADRICGGEPFLTTHDKTVLKKFAASPFSDPHRCERLAAVAQWC